METNDIKVEILAIEDNFIITRRGATEIVSPGDTVNQTITLYNKTDYEITGIHVKDTITSGANYYPNSLQIGGISYAVNPLTGFDVNEIIAPGNSETITYKLILDDPLPDGVRTIDVYTTVDFKIYRTSYTKNSDVYTIETPHGDIVIDKTSDKSIVIKGQTITFQNVVRNTGTLQNTDVFFQDDIPAETSFVEGSVTIDGTSYPDYNPQDGFSLGEIDGKSRKIVTFEVVVN